MAGKINISCLDPCILIIENYYKFYNYRIKKKHKENDLLPLVIMLYYNIQQLK